MASHYHRGRFSQFAKWISHKAGHPLAFSAALAAIVIWAALGKIFHFSDTWQLVINTGTTIITFLMVFLIQHTQNREGDAVQLKLDEIIRSMEGAHNALLDIEELSEKELRMMKNRYEHLANQAREALKKGIEDTHSPEVKE